MTPTLITTGPESTVTSREWSEKLKKAGWPQREEFFSWHHYEKKTTGDCFWQLWWSGHFNAPSGRSYHSFWDDACAAPTAEEILRRLPRRIEKSTLDIQPLGGGWGMSYIGTGGPSQIVQDYTLANAAAAMYCYLAENGLLPKA